MTIRLNHQRPTGEQLVAPYQYTGGEHGRLAPPSGSPATSPHPIPPSSMDAQLPSHLHPLDTSSIAHQATTNPTPAATRSRQWQRRRHNSRGQFQEDEPQREAPAAAAVLKESLVEAAREEEGGGGGNDDDEIPQVVFDRILQRILFTVGVPMASGVALLNVYDALKRGRGTEVPSWVQLLTILLSFGTSALGIAYGTLSASWDPEKEGSVLGFDELQTNWPEIWKEDDKKDENN